MVGAGADGSAADGADAHDDFIAAGADVIATNTYAVVPYHIGETAMRNGPMSAGARRKLARDAADAVPHQVQVAASIPPMFGSYKPRNSRCAARAG